jgi:hypothetical protein
LAKRANALRSTDDDPSIAARDETARDSARNLTRFRLPILTQSNMGVSQSRGPALQPALIPLSWNTT